MLKKIAQYYPFTLPGTVLLGVIFYLLGTGYAKRNPYMLFLSFAGLVVLVLLTTLSRIQAYRLGKAQIVWDSSDALYSARPGSCQRISVIDFKTWFFFRIHFRITGHLMVGNSAGFSVLREDAFTGEGALEIPLHFQLTGLFRGEGKCSIKDIFGLVRARLPEEMTRTLPVQPALLHREMSVKIDAAGGEDETQPRKSSDEEKYYMREYVPGDRFRDINWKATSRIGEIFTRISPVTETETQLVLVDFRHFAVEKEERSEHVAHLEYLKRWFLTFLWQLKHEQPDYQYIVYTGRGGFRAETFQDIQRLGIGISGLFYENDPRVPKDTAGVGEVYIFSTPFDAELGTALTAYSEKRVTLFETAFPTKQIDGVRQYSVMKNEKMVHFPGTWALKHVKNNIPRHPAFQTVRTYRQPLEIRLL